MTPEPAVSVNAVNGDSARRRGIVPAMLFAFRSLFRGRILWLMLWPVLAAALFWIAVVFAFWTPLTAQAAAGLGWGIGKATFFIDWDPSSTALFAAKVLLVLLIAPLTQFTALLIIGVAAMPVAVSHVSECRFPGLRRLRGGSIAGSLWNAVVALCGMALLFLVTLPLWLLPPFWPLIPVGVLAWANQRMLRYDALAEHASGSEMRDIFAERRGELYLLGILLALAAFVPVVGFFAPALFALGFAHYLLGELQALREASLEGGMVQVVRESEPRRIEG